MAEQRDDHSYLDFLSRDDTGNEFGGLEWSDVDTACTVALPDLDYKSQLIAIRRLLDLHRNAEAEHTAEIKAVEQLVRSPVRTRSRDPFTEALEEQSREQNWVDHLHYSVYHDAAHSMAAVGLIAPFVESIFYQSFRSIEREMTNKVSLPSDHKRWGLPAEDQWNCHYVWENGRQRANLVKGIMQLVHAVDLTGYLPDDLRLTLSALFEYRNKMFHCGFEWPLERRIHFDQRLSGWPKDWFIKATSGDAPWVFYMSPVFIVHCLDRTEDIVAGIGRFCKERFLWRP